MQFEIDPKDLDIIAEGLGELPLKKSLSIYISLKQQYETNTIQKQSSTSDLPSITPDIMSVKPSEA